MNGATSVMFDGVPNYPDFGRFWETVDRLGVTIFYTAPTAIRALMREGDEPVKRIRRKSIRLLGTVGEPINPEAWEWYWRVVGDGRCPVVDTWWQTETGGILIALPRRDADEARIGDPAACPGSKPLLVDAEGQNSTARPSGNLCLRSSWPGQMRTVWGDHHRFFETYFTTYPGLYFTGDGCRRDEDGYYWITGRVDDVINVSGHRIGTAEVESALVSHALVAEAAVVGLPARDQGPGHLRLRHAQRRRRRRRRPPAGTQPGSAPRHRRARHARIDPVRAGAAQDPLGQDHASHPAQDRRSRRWRVMVEYLVLAAAATLSIGRRARARVRSLAFFTGSSRGSAS